MKNKIRSLFILMALMTVLVSACGAVATTDETSASGGKPRAALVEFTGVIEAIDGNQWTINGQTITVDPSVLRDGPYEVGDEVKVEVEVQADGTVVVTRVEAPSAVTGIPTDDNSNDDNSNSANSNGNSTNSNSNSNTNDDSTNSNSNTNDDNSNDDSNGNNDNSNDDNNGNDDNSNDDNNGNDDNSGGGNSNDDDGDDNSGSGGGGDD